MESDKSHEDANTLTNSQKPKMPRTSTPIPNHTHLIHPDNGDSDGFVFCSIDYRLYSKVWVSKKGLFRFLRTVKQIYGFS